MTLKLDFGYNRGVPAGAKAVWGARLIVNRDGMVDLVHDRMGFAEGCEPAAKQQLLDQLNDPMRRTRSAISEMLRSGEIDTRSEDEHVIFDNGRVRIVGSAQSSAGYFYIVAYLVTSDTDGD